MSRNNISSNRIAEAIQSRRGLLGTMIFSLFVIASVMVNQTVQALNLAAGNYGYYGGTYGYNSTYTSSDAPPAASGTISATVSNTSADLSWAAPTTTTLGTAISTGSGSIASYNVYYSTSSLSSCAAGTGGSSTSSTTNSKSLTGLTSGTTYYVAVCAVDNNQNEGSVRTGSFTTTSASGGSTAGGGGGAATSIFTTPATTTTVTPVTVVVTPTVTTPAVVADAAKLVATLGLKRDVNAEAVTLTKVEASIKELKMTGVTAEQKTIMVNFITYGTSSATIVLGSGERSALVRDQIDTLGRLSLTALEQIATGQKPTDRNLTKERAQVPVALAAFKQLYNGKTPNFKVVKEDMAWNTLLYRIRFRRDLAKEKVGIGKFRSIYKKLPKTPFDWAAVRAYGYQLAVK